MIISYGNRNENRIALTFDDGPNPYGTPKVLDILDKYKIKATFFLIGKWVKVYPAIVKKINKKGHLIGNHGYSHSSFKRDFKECTHEIFKIIEEHPIYIRPPYFRLLLSIPEIFSKRFYVVGADVIPKDYKRSEDETFSIVVKETKNGSIIDLHDGSENNDQEKRCKPMLKSFLK